MSIYPKPPTLDSSALIDLASEPVFEFFKSPRGSMDTMQFTDWRVCINLSPNPLPLEILVGHETHNVSLPYCGVIAMSPRTRSKWRWYSEAECCVITISQEIFCSLSNEVDPCSDTLETINLNTGLVDVELFEIVQSISNLLKRKRSGYHITFSAFSRILIVRIIRGLSLRENKKNGIKIKECRCTRSLIYINANLKKKINVDDLARIMRMSKGHFARCFKEDIGVTPHQYIISCRVDLAAHYLRHTEEPIASITHICGFSDQPHLSRAFKKLTGQTPKVFREKCNEVSFEQ